VHLKATGGLFMKPITMVWHNVNVRDVIELEKIIFGNSYDSTNNTRNPQSL